jgi:PAS domain S-box-containing protein
MHSTAHENRVFLYETDAQFHFTYVSNSIWTVCGYSPGEACGRPIEWLFQSTEYASDARQEFRALLSSDTAEHSFEASCRHKNGSDIPVQILARLVRATSGNAIQGFVADLSAHRNAETQLRLSDEILSTINSVILVANGEGQIIYISPSVTRILGYSSTEALGYGWWLRAIPDNETRRTSAERIAKCARGEIPPETETWEQELLDKSGRKHWFLWQDAKGPDDLFIGVGQEITERKGMEDALEQSVQQVRAIFASALEGLLILDEDLTYVDVNPAACKVLGRTRDEIVGRKVGSFTTNPTHGYEHFTRVLKSDLYLGEEEIRAADGTLRNLEYSVCPNFITGRHLVVTRNVTERKRLESQLLQAQKMEAVGQLAGGVAHDFNNMLTVIRGYCELLQRQLPPESNQRRYADTILSATDKATLTTQQLLAFSRQQVIQPRELDLNSSIKETGKLLHRLIGEDVIVRFALADDLGLAKLDPGQLNQILLNLAVNARDAMPDGGTLTIETANATVDRNYAGTHLKIAPGEYIMLTVTDSGCGMTPETVSRIFEPFFTTKAAGKGTGLGLATVYGIVEQARGAIYVYSEIGEGTSFKLYFPRVNRATVTPATVNHETHIDASILVIDDDPETCKLTGDFLKAHGYAVECVAGGGEALQLCQRMANELKLIISDITMPGADGQDIQGYLAIQHPETKMIYISGYSRAVLRDRGILPPEATFLQKPFRMEDLLLRIEEVLE